MKKLFLIVLTLCLPLTGSAQYGPRIVTPAASPSPGASAYDVAVANGFSGTQTQWLASLQGTNGTNATTTSTASSATPGLMSTAMFTLLSTAVQPSSAPILTGTNFTLIPESAVINLPADLASKATVAALTTETVRATTAENALLSPSRLGTTGNAPTLSMASAAGTGAAATITGTNLAGTITMTTGLSLLGTGSVMTMTFADGFSFPNGCAVLFSPGNANFASVYTKLYATPVISGGRCTGVTISTALSLSISTAYTGTYIVIGW